MTTMANFLREQYRARQQDGFMIAGAACVSEFAGRSVIRLAAGSGLIFGAISMLASSIIHDLMKGWNGGIFKPALALAGGCALTAAAFSVYGIPLKAFEISALAISTLAGAFVGTGVEEALKSR
jgi:hypothetical protein